MSAVEPSAVPSQTKLCMLTRGSRAVGHEFVDGDGQRWRVAQMKKEMPSWQVPGAPDNPQWDKAERVPGKLVDLRGSPGFLDHVVAFLERVD